jgi:hypothetical protein
VRLRSLLLSRILTSIRYHTRTPLLIFLILPIPSFRPPLRTISRIRPGIQTSHQSTPLPHRPMGIHYSTQTSTVAIKTKNLLLPCKITTATNTSNSRNRIRNSSSITKYRPNLPFNRTIHTLPEILW